MFTDINNVLDIDHVKELDSKVVSICSSGVDGSFLIHHFLSTFIKQGQNVCFLALTQSSGHYNAVSQKLGANLLSAREKGQVKLIEGLKSFTSCLHNVDNRTTDSQDKQNLFDFLTPGCGSLQSMYKILKESYDSHVKSNSSTLFLIDNISVLTSLGATAKQVMALLHYLKQLVAGRGCLVVLLGNDKDVEDEVNSLIWKWMCHESDLTVDVYGLDSGFCKEVHGELTVTWFDPSQITNKSRRKKVMQYRIQDKTVSLFAPGTSAAVL